MADALGFDVIWSDWCSVPEAERIAVHDYFRKGRRRRATCALRPRQP
jgi:hypothetical protein